MLYAAGLSYRMASFSRDDCAIRSVDCCAICMWVGSVTPSVRSDQALRSMNGCDNGARTHHRSSLPPCCLSHCVRRAAPFLLLPAAVLLLLSLWMVGVRMALVRSPAVKEESDRSTHMIHSRTAHANTAAAAAGGSTPARTKAWLPLGCDAPNTTPCRLGGCCLP